MNDNELLELIVPFNGAYKGQTISYILQQNRGWVEFMAEKAYNVGWRRTFQRALTVELPKVTKELIRATYAPVNSPYPLSVYQQAIVASYTAGESLAVEARAGSGKTFVLKLLAEMTNTATVRVVAFNVHIAKELSEKLQHSPNVTVQTLHSAALNILRERFPRVEVDADNAKYRDIIREMIKQPDGSYDRELARVVRELTSMARLTLTDYRDHEAMEKTAESYNKVTEIVFYTEEGEEKVRVPRKLILSLTERSLNEGLRQAERRGYIDFDDMLWLCATRGYTPKVQADIIMADEAQDFNAAQIKSFLSLGKAGCQKVIVGDPYQAIQGFAYAAYDSYERLCEALGEHSRLTMPITYRCPLEHVKLAQEIVPDLQAREHAPKGTLEYGNTEDLYHLVKPGDLVICRTTAPLIKACINLLQRGTPAFVRGRALHKELITLVKEAMDFANVRDVSRALSALGAYKRHHLALLDKNDAGESTIESFTERVECCEALLKAYPVKSLEELSAKIKELTINPDDAEKVALATGHRAKGGENKRVFVLNYSWLPMVRGDMSSDQAKQEEYIHYVILTRSSDSLYLLDDKHESILDKKTLKSPEEVLQVPILPTVKETKLLNMLEELISISQKKAYKGRHEDITQLALKMRDVLTTNKR